MSAALSAAPPPPPPGRGPAAAAELAQALTRVSAERATGLLRVTGNPGGVVALSRGVVTAVTSPGAPEAATLLLRSGRITEADWTDAVKAGAADARIGAELVARTPVGTTELRAICQMAALDGAFAIAAGRIDGCVLERDTVASWLSVPLDIEPEWLLTETERRLTALFAARRTPISPFHDRLVPAPGAADRPAVPLADLRREILRRVNGRRSCRDVAFLLGRGLYAVTVEISMMLREGLIAVRPPEGEYDDSRTGGTGAPSRGPSARDEDPDRLPRRSPGAGGFTGDLPLRPIARRPRLRRRARVGEDGPPSTDGADDAPSDHRDQETGEP